MARAGADGGSPDGGRPQRALAACVLPASKQARIVYDVERIRDGGSFTTRRVGPASLVKGKGCRTPLPSSSELLAPARFSESPHHLPRGPLTPPLNGTARNFRRRANAGAGAIASPRMRALLSAFVALNPPCAACARKRIAASLR